MAIERLTDAQVMGYGNMELVGKFEVASRELHDDATVAEKETKQKNHSTLVQEIYRRMDAAAASTVTH